jgi:hypothetical protein
MHRVIVKLCRRSRLKSAAMNALDAPPKQLMVSVASCPREIFPSG